MNEIASPAPGLLMPDDPAPFRVVNPNGGAPVLLVCDHASNAVPARLHGLGLLERDLHRHIAYDIGAAEVTERLAERIDARAVLGGYTRLVIDTNRQLDHPSSIVTISDGVEIPGNIGLSTHAVQLRMEACFWPYHHEIDRQLKDFNNRGVVPTIISIHSFTPVLGGHERPWHFGIMWDRDERISRPLVEGLKAFGDYVIGENEPYSGKAKWGYSIEEHAEGNGLPNVLIEVREDLIGDADSARAIGDMLTDVLAPILADASIYKRLPR